MHLDAVAEIQELVEIDGQGVDRPHGQGRQGIRRIGRVVDEITVLAIQGKRASRSQHLRPDRGRHGGVAGGHLERVEIATYGIGTRPRVEDIVSGRPVERVLGNHKGTSRGHRILSLGETRIHQ